MTFGYFGLLSTYDGNGDRTGAPFYIATKTGTVTGQTSTVSSATT